MSGQYPSGYNSSLGGHRGQFNPQQQMVNPMNQMGGAGVGMGQSAMGGSGQGSGMMPMGGYGQGGLLAQQQQPNPMQAGIPNMGGGVNVMNAMGMQSSSHVQQQQLLQQQQMHMQQQQMAAAGNSQMNMLGTGGMGLHSNIHMQQQQQLQLTSGPSQFQIAMNPNSMYQGPNTNSCMLAFSQPTVNVLSLSRIGQETVQDITSRFQEIFAALKVITLTNKRENNTEKKVQEFFRTIRLLFKRVRIIFEKCLYCDAPPGFEYIDVESLIPFKDEPDNRVESEEYRKALADNLDLIEQVKLKNKQLREIIDRTRIIIWEINTMLSMRRS